MRRIAILLSAISVWSIPVFAQQAQANPGAQPAPTTRGGFTVLTNMGLGIQNDSDARETALGFGGINFGVGGFVHPRLAILGRFSLTTASYDFYDQTSGVFGPTVQYWA